jgi:hypothetical protein
MNYLSDPITLSPARIEAAGFTLKGLHALQGEARRSMLRALRFDKGMELTNADLDKSERLHDESDRHFDAYNEAMKKVLNTI